MSVNILIVDDSEFDRQLLVNAFQKKTNFNIIQASNGKECLKIVNSTKIDLILLDIMMLGMQGNQILQEIRKKFNLIDLPVIMVTAKHDATDVIGCLKLGANDYITKPVNFEVTLTRVNTHLRLSALSKEMIKANERAALDALITTYHHEINNPLAIAIAYLGPTRLSQDKVLEKLKTSLWRLAEVVKKINDLTLKKDIEFVTYTDSTKTLKIS